MSAQPSAKLADWSGIRQSLAEFSAGHEEFDHLIGEVFDEFDELTGRLLARQESCTETQRRTQADLDQATAELERQRAATAAARDEVGRLQEERNELRHERLLLEAELDTVRNRAAETAEALAEQRRELAVERTQWTEELKRMRRVTEALVRQGAQREAAAEQAPVVAASSAAAERPAAVKQSSAAERQPQPAAVAAGADPVLDSVMAQFELLQQDVLRRKREERAKA